jgi:hypothetical protein
MLAIPILNNILVKYLLIIREYLTSKLSGYTCYYYNNYNNSTPFNNKKIKKYIYNGYKKCLSYIENKLIYEKYTDVYTNKIEYDFIIKKFTEKNKDQYIFLQMYKFMMFVFYLIGLKYIALYDKNNKLLAITLCIRCQNIIFDILYFQEAKCTEYYYYQMSYGKIFNSIDSETEYISYGAGIDHLKSQFSNYSIKY